MEHLLYIKKKINDENTNFKDFRDMIIKDLISLPPNITSYQICTANKNKKRRKNLQTLLTVLIFKRIYQFHRVTKEKNIIKIVYIVTA